MNILTKEYSEIDVLKFNKYSQFTYNRENPAVLYTALRSPQIPKQNEILCSVLVPW